MANSASAGVTERANPWSSEVSTPNFKTDKDGITSDWLNLYPSGVAISRADSQNAVKHKNQVKHADW